MEELNETKELCVEFILDAREELVVLMLLFRDSTRAAIEEDSEVDEFFTSVILDAKDALLFVIPVFSSSIRIAADELLEVIVEFNEDIEELNEDDAI
jgi:hypothetical protein